MENNKITVLTPEDVSKLKVPELKKELKSRGLSCTGNKTELSERLLQSLQSNDDAGESVDDLDEDLLNEDDDDHIEDSVLDELESPVDTPEKPTLKRKLEDTPTSDTVKKTVTEEENKDDKDSKVIKISALTPEERLALRAKKFGVTPAPDVDSKKEARAARFGISVNTSSNNKISTTVGTDVDVLKKRAERFGVTVATELKKVNNQDALEKRKMRFGMSNGTGNGNTAQDEKAKARLERFKQPVK